MPSDQQAGLGSLPNEILLRVCDFTPQDGLYSLLLVSRWTNAVAEEALYRHPRLTDPPLAANVTVAPNARPERRPGVQLGFHNLMLACERFGARAKGAFHRHPKPADDRGPGAIFMAAFHARPERCRLVESLVVKYKGPNSIYTLMPTIESFDNLKSLAIYAPYRLIEDEPFRTLLTHNSIATAPEDRTLRCLHTCVLDFRDARGLLVYLYWEDVFLSSTIRNLTIQGCIFHEGDLSPVRNPAFDGRQAGCTPLEKLCFLDCSIDVASLTRVLALPRALKSIHLEQTEHMLTHWGVDMHPPETNEAYLDALRQQKHSLEYIVVARDLPLAGAFSSLLDDFQRMMLRAVRKRDMAGFVCLSTWKWPGVYEDDRWDH